MKTTDQLICDLFDKIDTNNNTPLNNIAQKILILSTPRSGSSLLCDVLNNTNVFGYCAEWFNIRYLYAYKEWKKVDNISFKEYFHFIMAKSTTANGVFTVNAHIEHVNYLRKEGMDILGLGFDKIFFVSRKNKLSQAVSLAKSHLSDAWSADAKEHDYSKDEIDYHLIVDALKHISDQEKFCEQEIISLIDQTFYYEDFSNISNPKVFEAILDKCAITYNGSFETEMKKQRNSTSQEIVDEFNRQLNGK